MLYYVIHSYIILSPCDMVLLVPASHHNGFFIRNSTSIVPIMFQIECFPTWEERFFFSWIFFTWHNLFFLPGTISAPKLASTVPPPPSSTIVFGREGGVQAVGLYLSTLWLMIVSKAFASLGGTSSCRGESSCRCLKSRRGRSQTFDHHHQFPSCPANQMISNCHLGLCRSII